MIDLFDKEIDWQQKYKKEVLSNMNEKIRTASKISFDGFIGWMGGKKKIAKELTSMLPPHNNYIEVFMGGGALFFEKAKAKNNVINDINSNLINLYSVVCGDRDEFNEFMFTLFNMLKSTELFSEITKKFKSKLWEKLRPAHKAAFYFYINLNSFNKDMEGTAFARNNSGIDKTIFQRLIRSREKLEKVVIENMDYKKLILKYNRKYSETLFFLDPPYVVADSGKYYEFVFDSLEHTMMKTQCDKIHKNRNFFIITYDDVPMIRKLYENYNIIPIEFTYSSLFGKKKKQKELVITNYGKGKQLSFL